MRESFEEYKSTIESNIIKFTYLYDGDVLSSTNDSYSEIIKHDRTSITPIINCISDIYKKSIKVMMAKSIEKVINIENDNIFYHLNELMLVNNHKPLYIFCSEKSRKLFNITKKISTDKPFPYYLYEIRKFSNMSYINNQCSLYMSPLIDDSDDELNIYVTDRSIQSLVYSIQNMRYNIENFSDAYKHTIHYNLYDCDFNSYKLVIKSLSRIREDKINKLLDDNRL